MLAYSHSFPDCLQRQFPECQPDGENHEATQATTRVPLSFTQTVCLTWYVPCTASRLNNLQRFFNLIDLMSSEHSIIPVSSECLHLFPAKIMSRLARWVAITHEEYRVCIYCMHVHRALQLCLLILKGSVFAVLVGPPLYTACNRCWAGKGN